MTDQQAKSFTLKYTRAAREATALSDFVQKLTLIPGLTRYRFFVMKNRYVPYEGSNSSYSPSFFSNG